MKFKTRNGQLVLRAIVFTLSFFLTVGNTLRTINVSQSVLESIKEAKKVASETKKDDTRNLFSSKFCEISQFDAGPGKEDLDHDIDGFIPVVGLDFDDLSLEQCYLFPNTKDHDIVQPPLFILYCQSKAYLG